MAGHSKWANIKHRKGAQDKKRGRIFSKIVREITVAAKEGGSDPEGNPNLKLAIAKAKAANMPADNIDRAIKKGAGEVDSSNYSELIYEGYGTGGVALLIACLTDNKNRTSSEVKSILKKMGGSLGEPGCVAYMFERKGVAVVESDNADEEKLMELTMEVGADDIQDDDGMYVVTSDPGDLINVLEVLEKEGIAVTESGIKHVPNVEVDVDKDTAENILSLVDKLEDLDDVQEVYANLSIPPEIQAQLN